MSKLNRRRFSALVVAALAAPFFLQPAKAADALKEVRIGYQKTGVLLITKAQKLLEKRFEAQGIGVKWVEFTFGPPLLEALSAGSIDYGYTGDAPPIFAQAAKGNLLYVAAIPTRGYGQAILVPPESPIKAVADLKGKKIGVGKGSSAHNLLIAAVESAGLKWEDINPVYLAPADAGAAFARGSIDAWSIWDPFYAIAELSPRGARPLPLSKEATNQNSYYLANRDFVAKYPEIVGAINIEIGKATKWADANRNEAAKQFAEASGVDLKAQQKTVERAEFSFSPLNDQIIAQQQAVADRFHRAGLIPSPIQVKEIVWKWTPGS